MKGMKGINILIVEDERVIAEEISHRLTNLGHEVLSIVSSGEEAVRKAGELHPDLVLMDIKLEGDMDGTEAAKQIRERFDIPVVFLTAYSDRKTLERAKVTEPFGYIVKPFEERDLKIAIEMALSKHEKEKEHLVREIGGRRMAEETLSVATEELDKIVSHKLRPPITIASGAIEHALDDKGEQVDRYLKVAKDSLKKGEEVAEDLMKLSSTYREEFKLEKAPAEKPAPKKKAAAKAPAKKAPAKKKAAPVKPVSKKTPAKKKAPAKKKVAPKKKAEPKKKAPAKKPAPKKKAAAKAPAKKAAPKKKTTKKAAK